MEELLSHCCSSSYSLILFNLFHCLWSEEGVLKTPSVHSFESPSAHAVSTITLKNKIKNKINFHFCEWLPVHLGIRKVPFKKWVVTSESKMATTI